jgi:hypothetical protein
MFSVRGFLKEGYFLGVAGYRLGVTGSGALSSLTVGE